MRTSPGLRAVFSSQDWVSEAPWAVLETLIPSSCCTRHDIANANQVVNGDGKREQPRDARQTTNLNLSDRADNLTPTEDFFDPFANTLTDTIALVSRRSS